MCWTEKLKELYGKPPYDPNDPKSFTNTSLRKYNEIIRKAASLENIPLIDILRAYDDYAKQEDKKIDDWLLDGMHPNDEGQRVVFELLVPVIKETIVFPKMIVQNKLVLVD
jgi:lysophospholipase L1-like esterase